MSMRTRIRHFHLLSKQWSCEFGLRLLFSLRAARVHTHHGPIYIQATYKRHVEKGLAQISDQSLVYSTVCTVDN